MACSRHVLPLSSLASCKNLHSSQFTEEEKVNITIVMEGITYGRRTKLERDSTENLMIYGTFSIGTSSLYGLFCWF